MRWSRAFIPTLREVPAEAEVPSHRLLLRAGYVRQVAAGLYAYLYLAQKSFLKIAKIVREEMNRIGGQEVYLPALNPAEPYRRIFDRCGLKWLYVEAYSGMMGGRASSEFTAPTDTGEDWIALSECGYAANLEKAESKAIPIEDLPGDAAPEPFDTPGQKTIEDLVKFTGESPARMIKTLDYSVESEPVVILLRGDQTLSETKLVLALGTGTFRPATPEEALKLHGAHLGSLGPAGLRADVRIIADRALEGRRNLITGANRDDTHLRNVTPGRDFTEIGRASCRERV